MLDRGNPDAWATPISLIKERLDLDGAQVLDVGCGIGGFSLAIAQEGGILVTLDISMEVIERMKFLQVPDTHPQLASAVNMPYRGDSFDLIILNGVLEYTAKGQGGPPRDVHLGVLEYVRWLLRPGGLFYLGIENRYYLKFILGARDHYEMRWSNILPRKLSTFISSLLGEEVRNWIYSHDELQVLLEQAGFNDPMFFTALPNYKPPEYIIPISDLKAIQDASLKIHSKRLYQYVCYLLAHSGWLYRKIGPDFIILSSVI